MSARGKSFILAITGGAFAGLCWLPLGLAPLFPIPYLLAMRGLRHVASGGQAIRFGLLFEAVRFAVGAHFLLYLVRHSPLGIGFYLAAIAFILPYGFLEGWGAWILERTCRLHRSIAFGLLCVVLEWCKTLGDLSFPADLQAHGFGTNPQWLAWSRWTGSYGITLLIVVVAMLLDAAMERRETRRKAVVIASCAVLLWLAPVLTDTIRTPPAGRVDGNTVRIGIVQPSLTVREKHGDDDRRHIGMRLEWLTLEAARDTDLVLWPESTRTEPVFWDDRRPFRDPPMEALARRAGVPILYGCEIARVDGQRIKALYNGAAIAYPDGRPGDWYGKQRLLPFAEGIPFAGLFGGGERPVENDGEGSILTMLGNFTPGPRPTVFEAGGARIGVLICYEGMYPSLARRYIHEGVDTLVLLTNDSWWGRSVFAPWHARMVASLARELEVPVVRAANGGVSSVTGADGIMGRSTELFDVTVLRVEVSPSTGPPTPYARVGDLPVWAVLALLGGSALLAAALRVIRSFRRPSASVDPVDP